MAKEYMSLKQEGLNHFLEELTKLQEDRWKPIWETYRGNTSDENDVFGIILKRSLKKSSKNTLGSKVIYEPQNVKTE